MSIPLLLFVCVGLKPTAFVTQPNIANCVSSRSSPVPPPALCVGSSDQCDCNHGCPGFIVTWCAVSSMTHVHVSSNQSLTHGQSFSCFCEKDYYVDELTSFTVTCQADGVAEMFRVGRRKSAQ